MRMEQMKTNVLSFSVLTIIITCVSQFGFAQQTDAQWKSLFDGKSLDGWKKVGSADSKWEVVDGVIQGSGQASMLVTTTGPYKDFRYRVEMKINDGGNSGLYFRTKPEPGFVDGYEAQVDSTHTDPIRTGSIYGMCHVYKQLVEPDTYFTYEIEVRDDVWRGREMTRIKVTVDGNELYEYLDFEKTFKEGHFAFQQHDPGSRVSIRKVEVIELGKDEADDKQPEPANENLPTTINIEKKSRRDANRSFQFSKVPAPSETDAGNLATVALTRGRADSNGANVSALTDGKTPVQEDQPSANYFLAGTSPGRLLFDFGKPIKIKQINSYSWHPNSRADQKYDVYMPSTQIDSETANTAAKERQLPSTWNKAAAVNSRSDEAEAGQVAVSINPSEGELIAETQFVLLDIHPTRPGTRNSQTFFSEIDFVDGKSYDAKKADTGEKLIDDLKIGEDVVIHFDTTEVPELRQWVNATLMPACKQWYPRIVEALPSEGFEAPTDFKVVFRKNMSGVAYTSGTDVYCAAPWYLRNLKTEAVGSVIHELVHVVQQYSGLSRRTRPPGWLVEGIADHIRWYQFEPVENRRRINWDHANYDDAYFNSATFLDYIVREIDPDAIKKLNEICRQGRYRDGTWVTLYGKTAEQIWEEAKKEAQND
jgi:hypothetical protein